MTDNKKIKANFQDHNIKVKGVTLLKKRDIYDLADLNLSQNSPGLLYRSNNDEQMIMEPKPMTKFKATNLEVNTKRSEKLTNYLMKQNVKNSNLSVFYAGLENYIAKSNMDLDEQDIRIFLLKGLVDRYFNIDAHSNDTVEFFIHKSLREQPEEQLMSFATKIRLNEKVDEATNYQINLLTTKLFEYSIFYQNDKQKDSTGDVDHKLTKDFIVMVKDVAKSLESLKIRSHLKLGKSLDETYNTSSFK